MKNPEEKINPESLKGLGFKFIGLERQTIHYKLIRDEKEFRFSSNYDIHHVNDIQVETISDIKAIINS